MGDIFDSTFRKDVSVLRRGEGKYINLVWVESLPNSFIIQASVQPTPAEIMLTLPEGYRTFESYTLYTNTELTTASINRNAPDVVILDNKRFLVIKVTKWNNNLINHFEIIVVRDESDVA